MTRFAFLDVLRCFAVLWMIQVHITNVILDPALKNTWYFDLLNISNGFVAPAFIFCAGSGLWIALQRKGAAYLKFGPELRMYLRRLAYILFWAYMMHVPFYSLERTTMSPLSDLASWLQNDVLQTIVFASLAVLILYFFFRDLWKTTIVCGVLAVVVMTCTVFIWNLFGLYTTDPIRFVALSPLSPRASPFPFLPWSCYLFSGIFFTGIFMRTDNKRKLTLHLIWASAVLGFLVFLLKSLPFNTPWTDVWWSSSPGMHLFRISGVVFGMSVLYLFEDFLKQSRIGKEMQIIGNESLFLYISHLLIVYGNVPLIVRGLTGFEYTGYAGVVITWVLLTVPLLFVMQWWHKLKKNKPELAQRMMAVQMSWMIVTFLLIPANFSLMRLLGLE